MCTSRKEIILNRSLATTTVVKESTNPLKQDNIIQIISDDESEGVSPSDRLSERFSNFGGNSSHQADDEPVQRLDGELIANRNLSFGGSSESVENYYQITPPKKRKIASFFQSDPEYGDPRKGSTLPNLNNSEEAAGIETNTVIEVESVSSNNRNTRLKSNSESSSEFIVSSSSRSTQPMRPRLKNTLPIDGFERCLNYIAKKYPEMTHEERVQLWKYSSDVSDVEDYTDVRQNIALRKEICNMSLRQRQPRKIQIENRMNNNHAKQQLASSSKGNNDINCNKTPPNSSLKNNKLKTTEESDVIDMTCNSNASKSTTPEKNDNNLEDENVLMSINTQTRKVYKNNHALLNANIISDTNVNSSPSLKLKWSDSEDSVFRKNSINPEIDKISAVTGLIQSRAVYKRNIDKKKTMIEIEISDRIMKDGNKQEQFKIPNVPQKYSSLSPMTVAAATTASDMTLRAANGATQKEEFYKYLGLETKSPNGKNNNNESGLKRRDKISPGRVTRLQREKFTKLMKFENKLLKEHNNRKKTNKNVNKSMINRRNENSNSLQLRSSQRTSHSEPKVKIVFSKDFFSPSSPPKKQQQEFLKLRRSCGCIINSQLTNIKSSSSPISANPVKNQVISIQNEDLIMSVPAPQKIEKSLSPSSKPDTIESITSNSWFIMRHSYKDQHSTSNHVDSMNVPKLPFIRDLSKSMPQESVNPKMNNISPLTLFDESIVNPIAAVLYKKFNEVLQTMKREKSKISILMRNFDEAKNNVDDDGQEDNLSLQMNLLYSTESSQQQSPYKESSSTTPPPLNDALSLKFVPTCFVISNDDEVNKAQQSNIDVAIESNNSSKIFPSSDDVVASSSQDIADKYFKNNIHHQRKNVQKFNSSKLYQKLLNDKNFIKFLMKNRSKFARKIIGSSRRRRINLKPKKTVTITSKNDIDESNFKSVCAANVKSAGTVKDSEPMEVEEAATTTEKTELVVKGNEKEKNNELTNCGETSSSLSQKALENPLKSEDGKIHHIYYEQDLLIVVQELLISFWKYSKVTQMMGKTQEWVSVGKFKRSRHDVEVSAQFKNRLCLSDTNPVYIELRARQFDKDGARECNMASVYVNVYHYNEWKASVLLYSVQLDTIKGLLDDISYTSITNSRYFVVSWKQEGAMNTSRTGICKYALTPDLDTLASIREFKSMKHAIKHLECISDEKLIGFGESQVTIWDHRTGDVLTNFDLEMSFGKNLGSVLTSLEFDRYLFLYQIRIDESDCSKNEPNTSTAIISNDKRAPELKIMALTLTHSHPKFRLIYSHELPLSFTSIKSSICTGDYLIVTAADTDEEFLLLPNQPEHIHFIQQKQQQQKDSQKSTSNYIKHFYTTGCHNFIEVTQSTLIVKTIHHYLLNFTK